MKYLILAILILIIKNILYKESFINDNLVSPDVISIIKKNSVVKITFQESIRKKAEFIKNPAPAPDEEPEIEYDILYINKSDLSSDSFDKQGNLIKYNLQNWNLEKVFSKKNKIQHTIKNLTATEYYFTVFMVQDGKQSGRIKLIKVSEKEPYNLFKFSESKSNEIGVENLGIKVYTPCQYYRDNKSCPDNLHGEILSRCYWDPAFEECKKSYGEEYLSD
jgi:hypothetical protein